MKIVKENYRYYGKTKICVGILRGEHTTVLSASLLDST